jgi:hypothetical protein
VIPSQGVSWLCDWLHLSMPRSDQEFFGDASVWMTTFSAPLLLIGAIGFLRMSRHKFALPLLLIAICGCYFALGPSLKINSLRPPTQVTISPAAPLSDRLMPEKFAIIPIGSAIFYQHVPGFKSMRATYRWSGLMFAGLYGLAALLLRDLDEKKRRILETAIPLMIVAFNIPNLPQRFANGVVYRAGMEQMRSDLEPLNRDIGVGRRVVFYPLGNDFIINYLAARGHFYTYNVGGDKNVEIASASWPASILNFLSTPFSENLDREVAKVLLSGDTDEVVIPYFDKLINASAWPPSQELVSESRAKYASLVTKLSHDPSFITKDCPLYVLISLRSPAR